MKRLLLILLALTLLLLPACTEEPDLDMAGEIHTSRVVCKGMAEYGDYIYISNLGLRRYNRKTGELTRLCQDPDCGQSCPLDARTLQLTQIVDGRLYFNCMTNFTRENVYAYLDLTTDELKVLLTFPKNQLVDVSPPVLDNGWLYYTTQRLREEGDKTDPDAYQNCVCRIPMDGGKSEIVCDTEVGWGEILYAVVDGKVITKYQNCFYTTDPTTGERRVLFDPAEHGFYRFIDRVHYLDGFFYVACGTSESLASEYYPLNSMRKSHLLRIDARTGKMKQLVEEPIYGLTVTEEGIYYTEQAIRIIYLPEDYEKHPEKVALTGSKETINFCDFDGNNRRVVYTDPNLDVNNFNCIIDNCLYGWICVYNEETQQMSDRTFAKLDLATGEITPATEVK